MATGSSLTQNYSRSQIGAREKGRSISEVAMKFGFSHTTISRVYREYREFGKTSNLRHHCGRKKDRARTGPTRTDVVQPFHKLLQILMLNHPQVSPCEPFNET
ncbi:uncharacterized protein TNCV_1831991 [Trichonephila clavipes]|nr:uncharacterized protein TNCV_1831991 [Trichonephila clavipes]